MNPKVIHPYFLFAVCCIFSGILWSQNDHFQAYSIEEGLPQSQVSDIVQDSMGYLWIGTQGGGLSRFDGKQFKVWNEKKGLPSNYVRALRYVNDSLFIGMEQGLGIKTKGVFSTLKAPQINKIYRYGDRTFLATVAGVFEYSMDGPPKKLQLHPDIDDVVVHDIAYDEQWFWVATTNGLWISETLDGRTTPVKKLAKNNFVSIAFYKNKVFAATFDDGIFVMDDKDSKNYLLIREPLLINTISIRNNKELWVATQKEGIVIIDCETFSEMKRLDRQNGLKVPNVRKIFEDNDSNVWIASSGGGFYKYFQNSFKHYDTNTGLKNNRVYAVHAARDGIWMSNGEEGLLRIDSSGIHQIPQHEQYADTKIKTITTDLKGNVWAGTDGRGIYFRETFEVDSLVIDSTQIPDIQTYTLTKEITKDHFLNSDTGFPSDWIRSLQTVGDTIWAASYSQGIVKFQFTRQEGFVLLKHFGQRDGMEDILIRDMKKDPRGIIWYATQKGHIGYIESDQVTHFISVLGENVPINMLLFHKDRIYLGTAGKGIWWANLAEINSFKKLKGLKELSSENIYQLIFDNQDNMWAGTELGVDKVVLNESNEITDIFHFGRNDGFLGMETCLNAVAKDSVGNLWFGALYGLTKYREGEIFTSKNKPKIHFEGLDVGYQSIDSINLNHWTNNRDKVLKLSPSQNQLSINYITVDLDHPTAVQYRFRSNKGEWSPWSSSNEQNLAGLAYGLHSFSVQSRNSRWAESEPITLLFFIERPLYLKVWFQITAFGVLILILALLTFLYVRRIQKRNKVERERLEMRNHLLALEQKALRLQMNPHFIFNVLNGIKGMGAKDLQKMNSTINAFATLLRETLHNSRKEHIALSQEIKTLKNYIEVEQLMSSKPFTFEISVSSELDAEEVLIPPMLIQPFVENAIRHGILKGSKEGKLKVDFDLDNLFLTCVVLDNGVGIFQSQQTRVRTDHQSMALTVTKERLESISGKGALEIIEIKNAKNVVEGTKVSFKIPLLTDY